VLLLNKLDVATASQAEEALGKARELNPLAAAHRAVRGRIEGLGEEDWVRQVLDVGGYGGGPSGGMPLFLPLKEHGLTTAQVEVGGVVAADKLVRFLGHLLDEDEKTDKYGAGSMGIYRIKGLIRVGDEESWDEEVDAEVGICGEWSPAWVSEYVYAVNGVNDTYEVERTEREWVEAEKEGVEAKLVFIGIDVDREAIARGIEGCIMR
jgi:G3E family GTPase